MRCGKVNRKGNEIGEGSVCFVYIQGLIGKKEASMGGMIQVQRIVELSFNARYEVR